GDGHRAAGAAFADDDRDDGHAEPEAAFGAPGDGLRLAALLGADAGIGTRRIHKTHDRQRESVGHLHQADGLAVAFGPRHPEIMLEAAFRVRALLMADDQDGAPRDAAHAADNGLVLGKTAIAGEWREVLHQALEVMLEMRPFGVAGDLCLLPR